MSAGWINKEELQRGRRVRTREVHLPGSAPPQGRPAGRPTRHRTLLAKAVSGEAGVPFSISTAPKVHRQRCSSACASRVRRPVRPGKLHSPASSSSDEIWPVRSPAAGLGGSHDEAQADQPDAGGDGWFPQRDHRPPPAASYPRPPCCALGA